MMYSLLVIAAFVATATARATFSFVGYELLGGVERGICRGTDWSATGKGYITPQQCADECDAEPACTAFDIARPRPDDTYDCYIFWTDKDNLLALSSQSTNYGCYKKLDVTLDANLKLQCDDTATISRSDDGGSTFTQIGTVAGWSTLYQTSLADVSPNTVIRVVCTDTGRVIAGFIGQIEVGNGIYETTNPITAGNWRRTAMSSSETSYVYRLKGTTPAWNGGESPLISDDAYWIWNSEANQGWQQFDFDFGTIWCELSGLNLLSTPHRCSCQEACSGAYCNTLQFAADRKGDFVLSEGICPYGECCCSCPNCYPFEEV